MMKTRLESLRTAETIDGIFFPDGDVKVSLKETAPITSPPIDLSATRKVWYEYLAQHGVKSAILSVLLPTPGPEQHAFLLGFESARHQPGAVEQLLAMAERVWARMSHVSTLQFDSVAPFLDQEACFDAELLSRLGSGFAARTQHQGALVRALYFRERGRERISEQDAASLQLILPLFAESAVGGAQLARQSQRSAMLEAMFDRVSMPMTMLSADAQPLFMNSAAKDMLEGRKWLIRSADGSLSCTTSRQSKKLRESIRLAATTDARTMAENVLRLDCQDGDWRLAYVVSAMSRSAGTITRCALLIVLAPGKMDAPTQLLEALGLLPSEQRFLGHFLKSSSLCSAAMDCGLSEETARTYLKRVRAKLGVHRQMELAGLISGLVLPIHAHTAQLIGD